MVPLRTPGFSLGLKMVAVPHPGLGSPFFSSSWSLWDPYQCCFSLFPVQCSVQKPFDCQCHWTWFGSGDNSTVKRQMCRAVSMWLNIDQLQETRECKMTSESTSEGQMGHVLWDNTFPLRSLRCCCHSWCISQLQENILSLPAPNSVFWVTVFLSCSNWTFL